MPAHASTSRRFEKALEAAKRVHEGQKRVSGEPYVEHPIAVAKLLEQHLHADTETLIAAVLHDALEDTNFTKQELQKEFGQTVYELVEGVTKVGAVEKEMSSQERNLQSIRKMFRVMGSDMRVLFIKIADRLHNMETLGSLRREKQLRIAKETEDIYCPLTDLLGLSNWKNALADLCLKIRNPVQYKHIEESKNKAQKQAMKQLMSWAENLQIFIHEQGVKTATVDVHARPLFEVFTKSLQRTSALEHIETYFTLHISVKKEEDCYTALGHIHKFAPLIPNAIYDYVAQPKMNGYRALHTSVVTVLGSPIVVVIQTQEMQQQAQLGAALAYKKGAENAFKTLPAWAERLLSLEHEQQELSDFFQAIQRDVFGEKIRVHIAGKKRKTVELPTHASVLDAAYYADKKIGDRLLSVSVNNTPTVLHHSVKDGDILQCQSALLSRRTAKDMMFVRTTLGQKLLSSTLSRRQKGVRTKDGKAFTGYTFDMLMDPFFSIAWRKEIWKRVLLHKERLADVGSGVLNPFDYIELSTSVADFFLINPQCILLGSQRSTATKTKFILRAPLEDLQSNTVIGLHTLPQVIEIHSVPTQENQLDTSKEIVSLHVECKQYLSSPFYFSLKWTFTDEANPLSVLSGLQQTMSTPVELLTFSKQSASAAFSAESIHTLRVAYEYLFNQNSITSVVRLSV